MLEMVSVPFWFLGLPLAIIGLFVASTLDRRRQDLLNASGRRGSLRPWLLRRTTVTTGGVVLSTDCIRWSRQHQPNAKGQRAPWAARLKWQQQIRRHTVSRNSTVALLCEDANNLP